MGAAHYSFQTATGGLQLLAFQLASILFCMIDELKRV